MMDPTLPRHPARRPAHTTYGTFIKMSDTKVILRAKNGDFWSSDFVSIQTGGFGYSEEGFERLPRPSVYDSTGKVVVQGDLVRIDFLNGDYKLPIVTGGFRAAKRLDDFFATNLDGGADPNRIHMRARVLDPDGKTTGEVRIQALEDGFARVYLKSTDGIVLFVGDDLDQNAGTYIAIDNANSYVRIDNGKVRLTLADSLVTIGTGGEETASSVGAEAPPLGTTLLNALNGVLTDIAAIGAGIPGGVAVPAPNAAAMAAGIAAGTYLATKLTTQ